MTTTSYPSDKWLNRKHWRWKIKHWSMKYCADEVTIVHIRCDSKEPFCAETKSFPTAISMWLLLLLLLQFCTACKKKLAKNVKKSRQKQKKQCLELPECFQSLILCAAYLWSVVGGVLQNGVCVSVLSLGLCLRDRLYTRYMWLRVFGWSVCVLSSRSACGSGDYCVALSFVMVNRHLC